MILFLLFASHVATVLNVSAQRISHLCVKEMQNGRREKKNWKKNGTYSCYSVLHEESIVMRQEAFQRPLDEPQQISISSSLSVRCLFANAFLWWRARAEHSFQFMCASFFRCRVITSVPLHKKERKKNERIIITVGRGENLWEPEWMMPKKKQMTNMPSRWVDMAQISLIHCSVFTLALTPEYRRRNFSDLLLVRRIFAHRRRWVTMMSDHERHYVKSHRTA